MATLESNSLLEVSLYLKGTDLDVEEVSRVLGVVPDKVNRRDEPKIAGKERPVYATTTWKLSRRTQSNDVSAVVTSLLSMVDPAAQPEKIPGLEDIFIDVFMANTVEAGELGASIEWDLTADALAALNRLGLSVRFSVCNVEP